MKKLSSSIDSLIKELCPDAGKLLSASKRNAAYIEAVRKVWADPMASGMILDHTNAFYVMEDPRPKKGAYKDKPYIISEVCIDDPAVRAEVDARRELLALALRQNGLTFEELHIKPARRGMRGRHPFREEKE